MPHLEIENLLETDVNTMRITMNVPKRKIRAKTVENAGKIFTLFIFFHKEQKRFLVTLKRKMYLFEGKQCTLSLTTHIAVKYWNFFFYKKQSVKASFKLHTLKNIDL